ncbi:unnamed protein product [Victoria cruziana]
MAVSAKNLDPAFQSVGQRIGTEIWRIENFQPVPLPKSEYGNFYMGDSYIILQTSAGKGGSYVYDIHFWLGKDTSQDEAGTAAIKTVELDAALGGRAVQHRELQGHESEKFLSYFKPCIVPLEGGVASGFKQPEVEEFETRLYICKGKRVVRLKQVPFARSSLNHDDVFILDSENKIYQFNGANSNIQERAKALEAIQYFKDKYHEGKCDVAIIDDGKLQAEGDSGEFWVLFGGFAPISRKVASDDDCIPETTAGQLYSISDGQLELIEGVPSKSMLENYKCYLLDCGAEIYVWVGRATQLKERTKAWCEVAEEFISSRKLPKATRIIRVIQGYEPHEFKCNFESWPAGTSTAVAEDGRGKVAALLKQQGVDVKGVAKGTPANEEIPPLLEKDGKLEVWRINGNAKTVIPKEEIGKFYSGDSYIVLYTYHSGDKKEDYFLCCWFGKDSILEDQVTASRLANTMATSLKGRPVQGRIFQGKEPPQFIALFQPLIVLKGGLCSGYKKFIADKGLSDDTYTDDSIALIQISGVLPHNNKAVQVDTAASSLSTTDCFVLQTGSSAFTWNGNGSTIEQQQLAVKVAETLKPGVTLKHAKEGTEPSTFWNPLGGKQSYTSKKPPQETMRQPHLYAFSLNKGKMEVSEVYNFSQDDLLTEDMMILDTHAEVLVWVGQSVDSKDKQKAFEIGEKYIEMATAYEGLHPHVPLYKVTEGNEPSFFTAYFSWDPARASVSGNSFQKKLLALLGAHGSEKGDGANRSNSNQGGPTQRASALAALNSAFNPSGGAKSPSVKAAGYSPAQGSQRAAAVAALSTVLTAEQKAASEATPPRFKTSQDTTEGKSQSGSPTAEDQQEPVDTKGTAETDEHQPEADDEDAQVRQDPVEENEADGSIFSYERLKAKSTDPVTGIDYKKRESYLSDEEFESVLGMKKEAFYQQPKWKQDMQKKKVDLF